MREIMTRKDAINGRHLKYYSGKACKYGHTSDRYTRNGACIQCLRQTNAEISVALALAPDPKRESLNGTAKMGMRIFHEDYPKFAEIVVAMTRARFPALSYQDVVGNGKCTGDAAGTGFYPFRVHPEDVKILRDVASAYCSLHVGDQTGIIQGRLTAATEAAVKERGTGAGEWKFT